MDKPRRGEVWRFDFSGSYAYELVGDTTNYDRGEKRLPCLIISRDEFNERTNTFTILGHTTRSGRVGTDDSYMRIMEEWSVQIAREPDNLWMNRSASHIDCNKLWTTPRSEGSHRIGTLAEKDMVRVEDMLRRLLTRDDMPPSAGKPFEDGTVIEMNFSYRNGISSRELFLVVSSPEWDTLRYSPVGTCTVVKVEPLYVYDSTNSLQSVLDVKIQDTGKYDKFIAVNSDVYTLQWNPKIEASSSIDRHGRKVGIVDQEQLFDVAEKLLWRYLDLIERR